MDSSQTSTDTAPADWAGLHAAALAYRDGVVRYLRVLGASADLAEDLTQETYVRLLRRGATIRDPGAIRGWLRSVALNLFRADRRAQPRTVLSPDALDSLGERDPLAVAEPWPEYLAVLRRVLAEMPRRQAIALRLRYADGGSRAAVAEHFGIRDQGAKALLRRARQSVLERMNRAIKDERDDD